MGYDIERFIEPVNEGLVCCICRDVLEDPLQSPCEHAFCSACIHDWLALHANCPEDREPLLSIELRPICRYMKNDLLRQQIRCRFAPDGCDYVCSLENISDHERACMYNVVPCPHPGCSLSFPIAELDNHTETCLFRRDDTTAINERIEEIEDLEEDGEGEETVSMALDAMQEELLWRLDERDQEVQRVLTSHRHYMDCREAALRLQMEELRIQGEHLSQKVNELVTMEQRRREKEEEGQREKLELLQLLRELQQDMRSAASKANVRTKQNDECQMNTEVTDTTSL